MIKKLKYLLIVVILFTVNNVHACVMCKATTESGADGGSGASVREGLYTGLNTGILYLMVFPYIVLAIIFRKQIIRLFKNTFTSQK